jgi:hypothetical protein
MVVWGWSKTKRFFFFFFGFQNRAKSSVVCNIRVWPARWLLFETEPGWPFFLLLSSDRRRRLNSVPFWRVSVSSAARCRIDPWLQQPRARVYARHGRTMALGGRQPTPPKEQRWPSPTTTTITHTLSLRHPATASESLQVDQHGISRP